MKRVFAILLTLCVLLSLAACGADQSGSTATSTEKKDLFKEYAGKYLIYQVNFPGEEKDYLAVRLSPYYADMYFDLRADGTAAGNYMGEEMTEGTTWNPANMTLTNAEGDMMLINISNGEMKLEINDGYVLLLREGDPRLDEEMPNMFQYLHNHIVDNGIQNERGHTVIVDYEEGEYGHKATITTTSDGKIFWTCEDHDGSMIEIELAENAQLQTVTMLYKGLKQDYLCTASFQTDAASYDGIPFISFEIEPEYANAESVHEIMRSRTELLFSYICMYLENEVGITLPALGFTQYTY